MTGKPPSVTSGDEVVHSPTMDVILGVIGDRLWTLAPQEHQDSAHRDITFGVTWQDVMQVVEDGLCAAFGVRFAVRHQIPQGKPGMIGGLYTDGPVFGTRHEAESEADRLHAAHPDHEHYVVEALSTGDKGSSR